MKYYAKLKPTSTSPHKYWIAYEDDKYLAYKEGWASYASGWMRSGYTHDSLLIDNKDGINGQSVGYLNLENPWNCTGITPDSFDGGAWCEGAIAGVLWDIYDSRNEIPYPYYPDSIFVDTTNDFLSMDYNEIWHIFDNYDPPGQADTNCAYIQHFYSGWINYNYGHYDSLIEICYHHYIAFYPPSKPISLSDSLEFDEDSDTPKNVRLWWDKNTESDLQGYRIYRQLIPGFGWSNLAENDDPEDTTYLDQSTMYSRTYEYKVTAYDTLGTESEYSDSVRVTTPGNDFAQGANIRLNCNIITDLSKLELIVPMTGKKINVKIYDCCGRMMLTKKINIKHDNTCKVNLATPINLKLASGVYFVDIESEDGNRKIEKFIIVK